MKCYGERQAGKKDVVLSEAIVEDFEHLIEADSKEVREPSVWVSGEELGSCKSSQEVPSRQSQQVLTFQKWLKSWNLLQLDDIRIVADVPWGLGALSYHHNIIHLGSVLCRRRGHWVGKKGTAQQLNVSRFKTQIWAIKYVNIRASLYLQMALDQTQAWHSSRNTQVRGDPKHTAWSSLSMAGVTQKWNNRNNKTLKQYPETGFYWQPEVVPMHQRQWLKTKPTTKKL